MGWGEGKGEEVRGSGKGGSKKEQSPEWAGEQSWGSRVQLQAEDPAASGPRRPERPGWGGPGSCMLWLALYHSFSTYCWNLLCPEPCWGAAVNRADRALSQSAFHHDLSR